MMLLEVDARRGKVRHSAWNGLDYAEVIEVAAGFWALEVYLLGKLPADLLLGPEHIHITGGRRITDVLAVRVEPIISPDESLDDALRIHLNKRGDFSTYKLCIIEPQPKPADKRAHCEPAPTVPLKALNLDPRYECLEFSFPSECASDLDCAVCEPCLPEVFNEPAIDYLAKDYSSFRQLMLDRLALLIPDWRERHVPDIGITLVEVLAYVGDHLSYLQDAVATEAYLNTARLRTSVRRHVRLMDYAMHEGCNARTFLWLELDGAQDHLLNLREASFITRVDESLEQSGQVLQWQDLRDRQIGSERYEVFEALERGRRVHLCKSFNTLHFYTWGESECCLRRGSTSATLIDPTRAGPAKPVPGKPDQHPSDPKLTPIPMKDNAPEPVHADPNHGDPQQPGTEQADPKHDDPKQADPKQSISQQANPEQCKLEVGDLLIFEEILGPRTGHPSDADPLHRHAVRLTKVTPGIDALYQQPVLEIEWNLEDALPFDLCLTSVTDAPACKTIEVSVAHGNVILVDHGRTLEPDPKVRVPVIEVIEDCDPCGCAGDIEVIAGKLKMHLEHAPLTFTEPIASNASARALLEQNPRRALPAIHVHSAPSDSVPANMTWQAKTDLLESGPEDPHVVVEIDDDGFAHLRFGDGALGMAPQGGHFFQAQGRVGNGPRGNVGAHTITHVVLNSKLGGTSIKPHNPMPARGGLAAESVSEVKLMAPHAHRRQLERAVTADDYARLAERLFPHEVSRAAARLRWAGSWQTLLVAIDSKGQAEPSVALLERIAITLERYRRIGHDMHVVPASLVALDLKLEVCVKAHFQRGHVKAAILERLGTRTLRDGSTGLFHPDNLTFGDGVFLSRIVAAVQALPGVESVRVSKLERYRQPDETALETGVLTLAAFEVARLDNDPDFPEHGIIRLELRGGR
jgi:hypothetical protein